MADEDLIPILKDDGGDLKFCEENLKKLFASVSVKNMPIAVISIAGAMRLGKSFLLNLLLHYLRTKGWEKNGDEWLKGWRSSTGFEWRGGHEGHTRGIVAWGRPIIVKRPDNGEKIAVILLDTQGNFDHDRSTEENIRIFALSTLFSSLQFFNFQKQILTSDLEYLQCFVEFANTQKNTKVETSIDTAQSKYCEDQYFQDIGFIVRDWPSPTHLKYGTMGGSKYMDKFLSVQQGSATQQNIKKYLKSTFRNIKCFLMPEPDRKVRIMEEERPEINDTDLGDEFRTCLTAFANEYLHPEKLNVKSIGRNQNSTGSDVHDYMVASAKALMNDRDIKMSSLMNLVAAEANSIALRKAIETFKEHARKGIVEEDPDWDNFNKYISEAQQRAEDAFEKKSRYGRNKYDDDDMRLEEQLALHKKRYTRDMQSSRYSQVKRCVEKALRNIEEKIKKCNATSDLNELEQKRMKICIVIHRMDSQEAKDLAIHCKDTIEKLVAARANSIALTKAVTTFKEHAKKAIDENNPNWGTFDKCVEEAKEKAVKEFENNARPGRNKYGKCRMSLAQQLESLMGICESDMQSSRNSEAERCKKKALENIEEEIKKCHGFFIASHEDLDKVKQDRLNACFESSSKDLQKAKDLEKSCRDDIELSIRCAQEKARRRNIQAGVSAGIGGAGAATGVGTAVLASAPLLTVGAPIIALGVGVGALTLLGCRIVDYVKGN